MLKKSLLEFDSDDSTRTEMSTKGIIALKFRKTIESKNIFMTECILVFVIDQNFSMMI